MYLIYPYLNVVINSLDKRKHGYLIVLLSIFFSVWPSFLPYAPSNDNGYGIISFILLYFIGAYLKRYYKEKSTKLRCFSIYICCVVIGVILNIFKGNWNPLCYNFVFNIIGSIVFCELFLQFDINSKLINNLSKHTFSVYVIHLNNVIVSVLLYKILNVTSFYNSKLMILHLVISVFIWFIASIVIDILFVKIIGMLNKRFKIVNRVWNRIDEWTNEIYFTI